MVLKTLFKNNKIVSITLFLLIFILNYFLKIIYLDSQPFWYDEIISVKDTLLDFGHIKHESEWDTNPPFYYYSLWVWCKMFGISEFSVRLMSVIFSSLATATLFIYTKKFLNVFLSFGVSLLFTFHSFIFYFSHEARCYSLLLFLIIATVIVFHNFQKRPTHLNALFLGLLNFLIIYTHYIAGLVVFFQFVIFLIFYRNYFKEFSLSFLLTLILILLRFTKKQFGLLFSFHSTSVNKSWIKLSDYNDLTTLLSKFLIHPSFYLIVLIICISSVYFYFGNQKSYSLEQKSNFAYIFLCGFGSIIIFFIIGLVSPVFIDRYIIFSIPFLLILFGYSLFNIHKYASLIIIPILCIQLSNLNFKEPKSMDYRTTAYVVKKFSFKKPMVILQTKDITGLFAYYYDQPSFIDYKHLNERLAKNNIFDIRTVEDLNLLNFKNQNTIVFCQTFEKSEDSKLIFDLFKEAGFVYVTSTAVKGVKISLMKKRL